jgi:hypothetical protein
VAGLALLDEQRADRFLEVGDRGPVVGPQESRLERELESRDHQDPPVDPPTSLAPQP